MKHGRCCERYSATAADLKAGQKARILSLGRGRGFRARMLGLGLGPGVEMEILNGGHCGPCLIRVGRQRVMLGSEMLSGIYLTGDKK